MPKQIVYLMEHIRKKRISFLTNTRQIILIDESDHSG